MKKSLVLFATLISVLCAAIGIAACDETEHTVHSFGEWVTVTEPTCTSEGERTRTCSGCDLAETEKIPALGHTFGEWQETLAATCAKEGEETRTCTVCGASEKQPTAKLTTHTFGEWQETLAATCAAAGEETRTCTVCGASEKQPTAKSEHNFGVWRDKTVATCLNGGEQIRECLVCSETETKQTPKAPHPEASIETVAQKDPTCTEAGATAGKRCGLCGETIEGFDPIEARGHHYDEWRTVADATCGQVGVQERECTVCGVDERKEIPKLEHHYVPIPNIPATCEAPGKTAGEICEYCRDVKTEQTEIPALGHDVHYTHTDADGTHRHIGTCSREDCEYTENDLCTLDVTKTDATCEKPEHHVHTCTVCNYTYEHDEGAALGHDFSGAWQHRFDEATQTHVHYKICLRATDEDHAEQVVPCDETVDVVEPTCASIGYTHHVCAECGNEYTDTQVPALQHRWSDYKQANYYGMYVHKRVCENCGITEGGTYYACTMEIIDQSEPTCEAAGKLVRKCKVCQGVQEEKPVPALGHQYGGYTTEADNEHHSRTCGRCGDKLIEPCRFVDQDKAPTCGVAGYDRDVCELCLNVRDNGPVAALEHTFDEGFLPSGNHKDHYHICTRCKYRETLPCPYATQTTPATCDTDEIVHYSCPDCKDAFDETVRGADGHEWQLISGSETRTTHYVKCAKCQTEQHAPHDFADSNICKLCKQDGLTYAMGDSTNTWAYVSNDNYVSASKEIVVAAYYNNVPVTKIGLSAFYGNNSVTSVVLTKHISEIDMYSFRSCKSLVSVRVEGTEGGGLLRIKDQAFMDCTSLAQAHLPETLQFIGISAFENCTALTDIVLPESVTEIDGHAFRNTGYFNNGGNWIGDVLYINTHLISARTTLGSEYTITGGTTSVSEEAFLNCTNLATLTIPATVTVFDRDAFKGCDGLQEVIYEGDFHGYLAIRFDNDLASPFHYASNITIKGAHDNIDDIPDHIVSIPAGAFRGSQIQSITLHANIASIGARAFMDCTALTSITVLGTIRTVGKDAFLNTGIYNDPENWTNGLLYIETKGGAESILVATKSDEIGDTVVLNENTTAIAPEAFKDNKTLTTVTLTDALITIGERAFEGCNSLTSVTFADTKPDYEVSYLAFSPTLIIGRAFSEADKNGGRRNVASEIRLYCGEWKLYSSVKKG